MLQRWHFQTHLENPQYEMMGERKLEVIGAFLTPMSHPVGPRGPYNFMFRNSFQIVTQPLCSQRSTRVLPAVRPAALGAAPWLVIMCCSSFPGHPLLLSNARTHPEAWL